jgi:hypothetical protein
MTPTQLSKELRTGSGDFLEERRSVVALSLTAIGCMGLIAAYQMGLIRRLPDLPLPLMDAEKVDASDEAYEKLSTPDAFIGLGSYAATMGLAAMGGKDRAQEQPWIPLALAAKASVDALQAAKLTLRSMGEAQSVLRLVPRRRGSDVCDCTAGDGRSRSGAATPQKEAVIGSKARRIALAVLLLVGLHVAPAVAGSYQSGGKKILVDDYPSAKPGKRPAIILLHGSAGLLFPGLDLRKRARDLSEQGYAVFVPHFFNRTGHIMVRPAMVHENLPIWTETVRSAVSYVAAQPNVDANRIAVMGHSLGGYLGLAVAGAGQPDRCGRGSIGSARQRWSETHAADTHPPRRKRRNCARSESRAIGGAAQKSRHPIPEAHLPVRGAHPLPLRDA